jgi:hypothetical protein
MVSPTPYKSDDMEFRFDDAPDREYGLFQVITDTSDVMANFTDTNRIISNSSNDRPNQVSGNNKLGDICKICAAKHSLIKGKTEQGY